jgi:hypothetical protein
MTCLYGNENNKENVMVYGMMDTGSLKTLLDFNTAMSLGIENPKVNHLGNDIDPEINSSLLYEPIECYPHMVLVHAENGNKQSFRFPLRVRFAEKIKLNIFGRNWLREFCLAYDEQSVYLLHA